MCAFFNDCSAARWCVVVAVVVAVVGATARRVVCRVGVDVELGLCIVLDCFVYAFGSVAFWLEAQLILPGGGERLQIVRGIACPAVRFCLRGVFSCGTTSYK